MVQPSHLLGIVILILIGYSSELEVNSEESTMPRILTTVVPLGKRLKLSVISRYYPALSWRFNGTAVSEKCEKETSPEGSTLICTNMDWSDAGLYEYRGITKNHQDILLAVNVKIAECSKELAAKQRIEWKDSASQESEKCFCSGITHNCSMANDLFRSKITASISEKDMVELHITATKVEEYSNEDHESELSTYYILPEKLNGNLLKSYGGYLDLPSIDNDIDKDKPDLVLQSKSRTLVYFERREQVISRISGELSRNLVYMNEQNWRQLNNSAVSREMFLTVLSNVNNFYVKYNQYMNYEPVQIVLDSADIKDHGLGKVTTIEKCNCRSGYTGLSCESCSRGFYRRPAVREQGICVSIKEKLEPIALRLKHQLEQIQNKL
ncbi:laminin subunit alpha-2-like [Ochlerotatus camptorhynchus]|uniref:laminin subunit alpha-2-like n=1 Tax=Ochlerotatus camptorhynchus TaxID=644619 RepID=UPI0031E454F6